MWSVKSTEDADRFLQESLTRTGAEYFDMYLLHSMNAKNEQTANRLGMYQWAQEQKKRGLVKHVGFSFHDTEQLLDTMLAQHPEMEFVYLQLNYMDILRGKYGLQHALALKYQKPIVAMEPIKGGSLAVLPDEAAAILQAARPGASAASWAMRYAAGLEGVISTLSGMSTPAQMADNVHTFADFSPLSPEEMAVLEACIAELGKLSMIGCTGCNYCMPYCPKDIQISSAIACFNEFKRAGHGWNREMAYRVIPEGQRAADCIACNVCNAYCPQKLDIPAALKTVAGQFS